MGSNPIPSIVALVRIPDIRNTGIGQKPKVLLERSNTVPSNSDSRNHTRDIYNRQKKLLDWIESVKRALDRSDRTDILKFVEYMTDNANAILWITHCITALISMKNFLRKSFRNANKEDIRALN